MFTYALCSHTHTHCVQTALRENVRQFTGWESIYHVSHSHTRQLLFVRYSLMES